MKLTESILAELRHQCERQATRNYKAVEVDHRTLLALLNEVERGRVVALRFEVQTPTPGSD